MRDDIVKKIKKNGRLTKSKKIIIEILENEGALSIFDIEEKLKGKVNNSTIYRNLKNFVELDIVEQIIIDHVIYYTIKPSKKDHRHYMICKKCYKKTEIDYCPMEHIKVNALGCDIIEHKLELIGVCSECKNQR